MSEEKISREEFEQKVIQKAQKDEVFRQELITNPAKACQALLGRPLPDNLEINVVEETPTKIFLVLPPALSGELSEEDLEKISGGFIRQYM